MQSVGLTFTDIGSARVKVAAATKEVIQSQVKYLQFGLNGGRLNNQLRSLDGAMRWAKALNRTLFVPTTCLRYKEGESSGYQRCARKPHLSVDARVKQPGKTAVHHLPCR